MASSCQLNEAAHRRSNAVAVDLKDIYKPSKSLPHRANVQENEWMNWSWTQSDKILKCKWSANKSPIHKGLGGHLQEGPLSSNVWEGLQRMSCQGMRRNPEPLDTKWNHKTLNLVMCQYNSRKKTLVCSKVKLSIYGTTSTAGSRSAPLGLPAEPKITSLRLAKGDVPIYLSCLWLVLCRRLEEIYFPLTLQPMSLN